MSPVTHFLTGLVIANAGPFNRRERAVITFAAVVPDIDGIGIIPELLTRHSQHPLLWFSQYHHSLHIYCSQSLSPCLHSSCQAASGCPQLSRSLHFTCISSKISSARGPDG